MTMGINETIIYNALKTSFPGERIRVQVHSRNGVAGYAVEVVREYLGEEYEYVGWISMKAFRTEPWPVDQRHMIDRAFVAAMQERIKEAH